MSKLYYKEINIARGIGIMMVVLFHSIGPNTELISYIKNICNIVQMPLFFFISGFVAFRISKIHSSKEYLNLIKSKLKRLIIPYVFLGLLMFIPKLLLNSFAVIKLDPSTFIYDLLVLGNNPITFLWFLYVLFMIFVVYTMMIKKNAKITLILNLFVYIALSTSNINIYIFRISTLIYYANYFILGFIAFNYYNSIKDKVSQYIGMVSILSTFYILIAPTIVGGNIFVNILNAIIGIIGVISISIILSKIEIGNLFEYIGKYSYDIYLLSWFGQNIIRVGAQIIGINLNTWIVFICMFIGGMSVIFVSKCIFRNNKYTNKYVLGN